jgi:hypothetical protein
MADIVFCIASTQSEKKKRKEKKIKWCQTTSHYYTRVIQKENGYQDISNDVAEV